MEKEDKSYIDKVYDNMLANAKNVDFNEKQLIYIIGQIIETVSPSLQNLQEQIDDIKSKLK